MREREGGEGEEGGKEMKGKREGRDTAASQKCLFHISFPP